MNDHPPNLPPPPGQAPNEAPSQVSPAPREAPLPVGAAATSFGSGWPGTEALPYQPPTEHEPPLPPEPPTPGTLPPPWDPHGRLAADTTPFADPDLLAARRRRWYGAAAAATVLFVLVAALVFSYRLGQSSSEAAQAPTTTAPPATAPTASPTPSPSSTEPGASTTAPPQQSTTTTAPPRTVEEAKVRAEVDTIAQFVERVRGLEFTSPPHVEVFDEESFKARIAADMEKDREAIEAQGAAQKALGLVPQDVDYFETLKKLRTEGVAGFFDPSSKELVVRGGGEIGPEERVTIAHELTHALQDQHFNLDRDEQYKEAKDEVAYGFKNVAEGDATRVEQMFVQTLPIPDRRQFERDRSLVGNNDEQDGIPPAMRSTLQDPYVIGFNLVEEIIGWGGQAELDKSFNDPPKTSEQVLHPNKFRSREPAIDVQAPPAEGGGKTNDLGMVGENITGQLLGSANDAGTSRAAAQGWGGDHAVSYESGDQLCLRVDYAMDTPADLDELKAAYGEWAKKDPQARRTEQPAPDRLRVTTCIPKPPSGGGGSDGGGSRIA